MLALEEILCELNGEDMNEQGLPPGFRFHPTDEELITFYLASKVFNGSFCGVDIAEVDLNRCEPWELPDVAKMGEREWYFFSLRDRKYPTGLRTNRATGAGYWKATGKDREVYSSSSGAVTTATSNGNHNAALLGMKKTLVFYKGRAPRGEKTKWVMHEYRLDGDFSCRHTCKEEWVICRIFHKMGEKKNGVNPQGQSSSYMQEEASNSSSVAPLLENGPNSSSKTAGLLLELQSQKPMLQQLQLQPILQNPFMIHNNNIFNESDLKCVINNSSSSSSLSCAAAAAALSPAYPINVINGCFQTSFSKPTRNKEKEDTAAAAADTNKKKKQSPSSFLIKSLLSHHHQHYHDHQQYYYSTNTTSSKEQVQIQNQAPTTTTIPIHCKTEPNFPHFQFTSSSSFGAEFNNSNIIINKIHQSPTASYQSPFLFGTMDSYVNGGGFPSAAVDHDMSTSLSSSSSTPPGELAATFNRPGFHQMLVDPPIRIAAGESWPFHF